MRSFAAVMLFLASFAPPSGASDPRAALDRDEVTILVTDSGLGGLSVAADIERQIRHTPMFRRADVVFCSALPPGGRGYNDMSGTDEKAAVFSSALDGMMRRYAPDVILIACNTLSVIYDRTEFSKRSTVPVVGIVEIAADELAARWKRSPSAAVLLFGTETTVASGAHRAALVARGVPESLIIAQACPKLESEIQTDPAGDMTRTYIEWYTDEAGAALPTPARSVIAGLCCTHYGYSAGIFARELSRLRPVPPEVIDPNPGMSQRVLPRRTQRFPGIVPSVLVVSPVKLSAEETEAVGRMLRPVSPATADALTAYRFEPHLFPVPEVRR
ncbi:MAG: hypothetical protein F9K22_08660 [Bacteroidetes bacterium]|nr:MAG: hypothetical protein F9K22_08660 [Bacteroidota bacterium]